MPSKYAMTSNMLYDEKLRNDVHNVRFREYGSAIYDCLVNTMFDHWPIKTLNAS